MNTLARLKILNDLCRFRPKMRVNGLAHNNIWVKGLHSISDQAISKNQPLMPAIASLSIVTRPNSFNNTCLLENLRESRLLTLQFRLGS
jgi:hypothetical protein